MIPQNTQRNRLTETSLVKFCLIIQLRYEDKQNWSLKHISHWILLVWEQRRRAVMSTRDFTSHPKVILSIQNSSYKDLSDMSICFTHRGLKMSVADVDSHTATWYQHLILTESLQVPANGRVPAAWNTNTPPARPNSSRTTLALPLFGLRCRYSR